MGFEKEFASYEPLRRIVDSKEAKSLIDRLRVRKDSDPDTQKAFEQNMINKKDFPSDFIPDYVIAIDGGFHAHKIENGFPGAELGCVTISSVLIIEKVVRDFGKQKFIDPKPFRETEKASAIETIIPGCNSVLKEENSAKASMRRALFESLHNTKIFEEGETLLDTYEHLLGLKQQTSRPPKSPIDSVDDHMSYDYGEYRCPHSGEPLYSSDALRLHELMVPSGSSKEMYGQVMSMLEKLWLIHILRSFEKKQWLMILGKIVFVLDGPLACFSTWSWMNQSIIKEIKRINAIQKEHTGKDLLIIGIEKSGNFYNHFEALDTAANGSVGRFPKQSAFLLSDSYIKKNIIFSESNKPYGQDTYFGRKFFYKTKSGYRIVPVVAFLSDKPDLASASPKEFTRLADVMNAMDELVSSRYPNSISPLVSAHAEAAIPLNIGNRIFDDIAREIRKKSIIA